MVATTQKIKRGYKHTEVGEIPSDWTSTKIPDATVASHNAIKIGPFGSALKKEYLTRRGYKVYGQENVYAKDMSVGDRYLSPDHFRELKSCEIVPGDFLVSMMGTVGQCMIVPSGIAQGIMDSHLLRIKFDSSKVDARFIVQLFETQIISDQIKQLSVGGIMEGLSSKIIKSIYLPLPPTKQEQGVVANTLADVDSLISRLEKIILKKKNVKQAAMQQLLTGKRRLQGFKGDWKVLNVFEKSALKARIGWHGLTTAEYRDSGKYYLVTGTDFVNSRIDWANCWFVDESRYAQDRYIQLREGDVLITKDGTIGKVGYVDELPGPATLNSGVFVIRPKDNAYEPLFLYHILTSHIFDDFLARLQAGSTINHLYQKDFVSFNFKAPEPEEQRAIAAVLSDMDAEIEQLNKRLEKYRVIKVGMMQQLLTGKIRIYGNTK